MSASLADSHPVTDWHRPARLGYVVIFITFVICGGWAFFAQINSAVVAQAFVATENNRIVVQHLEGGIVGTILVAENQHVTQGDVIMTLSEVQARASMTTVRNQLVAARVQEARLIAERDQTRMITIPEDIVARANDPIVANAITDQQATFRDRQSSLQGQIEVLESRIQGLQTEIQGLSLEENATRKQTLLIDQELESLRSLLAQHLVQLARVLALEREKARLEGMTGRSISDQGKARVNIGEARLQMQELRHKFQEETAASILDIRQKIADLRERMTVTTDVLGRIEVRAPVSGTVQSLKIYGTGQVVRPGEAVMEIVPDSQKLLVHAHFAPTDIDRVHRAKEVEVRFPAFHSRSTPVILGEIASVSEDRLMDDTTHQPYYLGLIAVNRLKLPEDMRARLRPGMPAEVIAPLESRTVITYLLSPLRDAWHKSFREQ